jgi:DNA polymerase elongation subunit (family B)
MYPNITISNNISPETKVGLVEFKIADLDVYHGLPDDELTITMDNGKRYELTREKLEYLIQQKNLVMSANGCLFTQNKEGLFPQFMREVYSKRVAVRKEIKVLQQENEKMENEIKELEEALKK